jgi:probable rRNA maturation factor
MSTSPIPKLYFFFWDVNPYLADRSKLKSFIHSIFRNEGKRVQSLSFIFTNDGNLLSINKQYLNHDYFTDILTFDLSDGQSSISAEVYISCDRVKENALIHRTTFKEEIHRVIFHGVLHLCGYNDKTPRQSKRIRGKEDLYLAQYLR